MSSRLIERIAQSKTDAARLERQRRVELREEREAQKKKDCRRRFIIGDLIIKYFPEVSAFEPGTNVENAIRFEGFEAFLVVLSSHRDLVQRLQNQAVQMIAEHPDGAWRLSNGNPHKQTEKGGK